MCSHGFPPIRVVHSRDLWGDHANGFRPDPPKRCVWNRKGCGRPGGEGQLTRRGSLSPASAPVSSGGTIFHDVYTASRMPSLFRVGSSHTLSVDE